MAKLMLCLGAAAESLVQLRLRTLAPTILPSRASFAVVGLTSDLESDLFFFFFGQAIY
jgi:hypothetical protein